MQKMEIEDINRGREKNSGGGGDCGPTDELVQGIRGKQWEGRQSFEGKEPGKGISIKNTFYRGRRGR